MLPSLDYSRQRLTELSVIKRRALADIDLFTTEKIAKEKEEEDLLKSRAIVQKVAEETQKNVEIHISNIVSLALSVVFPDPYEFKLVFAQRRGRTECDLLLTKGGETFDPLTAAGGGVVDVVSFALRVALWSLKKRRNLLILDEPFRFVSVDLQERCSAMLKELSDKLGVQIVMVSHLPNIITSADTVFLVENARGESVVLKQTGTGNEGHVVRMGGEKGSGRSIRRAGDGDSKAVLKRRKRN